MIDLQSYLDDLLRVGSINDKDYQFDSNEIKEFCCVVDEDIIDHAGLKNYVKTHLEKFVNVNTD